LLVAGVFQNLTATTTNNHVFLLENRYVCRFVACRKILVCCCRSLGLYLAVRNVIAWSPLSLVLSVR